MKSKDVRNRYAFWTAFLFTSLVAVAWFVSMPARFSTLTNMDAPVQVQGGASRYISNSITSFKERFTELSTTKPVEESEPVKTAEENDIDFATFFSTSSMAAQAESAIVPQEPATVPREVLIGTSSRAISTSTGY